MGSPKGELLEQFRACPKWDSTYENHPGTGFDPYMTGASDQAKDLFKHLCDIDWKQRYTAEQALKHEWFKNE